MENSTRERGNSFSLRREPINGDLALSVKMADEKAARDKVSAKANKKYWDAFWWKGVKAFYAEAYDDLRI